MIASTFVREANAAALRASPTRKQVRRTVRLLRPVIGERSRTGFGKGGRMNGRVSRLGFEGVRWGSPVADGGI